MLASGTTEHKSANPCPRPTVSPLVTNPTRHIEEYRENFLSVDKTTELNTMLGALPFSTVNGRSVASFGEEYHCTMVLLNQNLQLFQVPSKTLYERSMMILCMVMKKLIKLSSINTVEMVIYQSTLIMNQQLGHTPIFSLLRLVMPYLNCV